jgi:hypothetical protein
VSAEAGSIVGRFDVTDEHGHPVSGEDMPGRVILREGIDEASLLVRNVDRETGSLRWFLMKARRLAGTPRSSRSTSSRISRRSSAPSSASAC